ncbi:Putative mediator complex, subunit Med14 [Septoria linicola]|uniref:Mediator of RNA polymerase II transcription subunit 14 n=1 Tax=Septoria linicola TaxID=215465 RepID=A0A9Q9B8C4_9PEZI|nr:putative mediator complex, subunit Med14 [Septoria linicola]USW58926.1 Putative mediator complex, subunit Med14 [Septoria linicola]
MPGRLIMNQQGTAVGSPDLKKDRSQAQIAGGGQKQDFGQMQENAHAKAGANGLPNGQAANGLPQAPPTSNGHANGATTTTSRLPTPPPLDQSWRTSDANKPMGVMLARLAQQCFGDLNDTLNRMNEMPAPQPAVANGVISHTADQSRESVDRKKVLMEFASGQRDRFIKALVLSDWARSEHDMAKLVDLKVWHDSQEAVQHKAMHFIGVTKHDIARAKMPNPNIEGAMELLASRKAPKWPDLGYLPPAKLTAKQLRATLQNMNVTIATRLNLHEDLPFHFRDYSIADGRATFRVNGEFEVDLSVADEDPASQFYLIDLRFTFDPAPTLTDDALRNALEAQTNEALKSSGLLGCYDFLHNFVLTHKINILKSHAVQLFRQKWFGCVVTETHRRVFAIQYWKDQTGKKSWLEFGVSSGRPKGRQTRKAPTAIHTVRWFRQGQEVDDDKIVVDWNSLDLDAVLAQVTAKHASWTLSLIQARLQASAGPESRLESHLSTSLSDADECKLDLSVPGLKRPMVVQVEPVTGLITISPATRDTALAERILNQNPTIDNSNSFAQLLCRAVQEQIRRITTSSGWHAADLRTFGPQANFKALFGQGVVRHDIFTCHKGWGEEWSLCVTYSLSGEKWWVVRIGTVNDAQGRSIKTVADARRLQITTSGLSRTEVSHVERLAEAEVSFAVLADELASNDIPYHLEKLSLLTLKDVSTSRDATAAVYLRHRPKEGKTSPASDYKSLATTDWIRIAYRGLIGDNDSDDTEVRHDIRLTVDSTKLRPLQEYLINTKARDADVAMNASGGLALSLRTPFGQPYIKEITRLVKRCQDLNTTLSAARALQYTCTSIGLKKVAFTYGTSHQFNAALVAIGTTTSLKLGPSSSNPHQRIRMHLEALYNKTLEGPFLALAFAMNATQPLLDALANLESTHAAQGTITVHAHDHFNYFIMYHKPLTPCRFQVGVHWTNKERATVQRQFAYAIVHCPRPGEELPTELSDSLVDLSKDSGSRAEGWFGNNKGGYITGTKSLSTVLSRVDDCIRKFEAPAEGAAVKKQEKQETPLPDTKPPLNRNASKSHVTTQQKSGAGPQSKVQQKPLPNPMKQNNKPQDNTARQMTVTATHGQRQNQHPGKVKQEVIELD